MIKRQLGQRLSVAARQMPVVSITGPRQSGKTTLCKQTFPGYFYMNLENPQTRIFAK
ncbi:MAG: AAA family ATPase, partial [Saprospiraceae bacterium]|nr:AAA family ATPase [Saprospiraceae bacterium]